MAGALVLLDIARFASPAVNRRFAQVFSPLLRPAELTRTNGSTYVALSSAIAFTLFPAMVAVTVVCFLAVGDAAAGYVGERWGRARLPGGKSLEGAAAFFLAALGAALALRAAVTGLPAQALAASAAVAALVESLPLPVNDNLSVPLASGLVLLAAG